MATFATPTGAPLLGCNPNVDAVGNPSPVEFTGQQIFSAPVSTTNGLPVLSRMRSINILQGQCSTIEWQLHDTDGRPIDLTPLGFGSGADPATFKVVLRVKEYISLGNKKQPVELPATVADAAVGKIHVEITKNLNGVPGIYFADAAIIAVDSADSANNCPVFSNTFYLVINRSTFGSPATRGGPPSIAEIRLHLRDSAPEESYLIESLMFDDAEIALAIARPVQYWNETPPPIGVYDTQSFPYRYHWLEGICGNLFMMVAEQFRRNQLGYSAAGVSVDDQAKAPAYDRAGKERWDAYRSWVRTIKASINLEGCYGEVTSNYKYSAYTDAIRIRY